MIIVSSVKVLFQTLDEFDLPTTAFDKFGDVVNYIERVCPFIAYKPSSARGRCTKEIQEIPSVHPLFSPAQLPSAFRASIKPVLLLNKVNGECMDRS